MTERHPSYPEGETQIPLSPDMVIQEARELHRYLLDQLKPYSAGVVADCISTIEILLSRPVAQRPTGPRVAERLADVVMMLDTPDAYNREYIAAVCRSILSALSSTPAQAQRYRHKKRGSVYRVLHEATMSTSEVPSMDDEPMVVYQCETDGKVWVRPVAEFYDGIVWLSLSSTEGK